MKKFLAFLYLTLLKSRYKVEYRNEMVLKSNGAKLFLPNHPALVDPQILLAYLIQKVDVAPMVGEHFFNNPIFKPLFVWMGAVPISDLEAGNRDVDVLKNITTAAVKVLESGKSIVIYPSGQLQKTGLEKINNKQEAYTIVKSMPNHVRIIGIRIQGLWGSVWSKAKSGKSPNFIKIYLYCIWLVFANLLFFVPKRNVVVEFQDITEQIKELDFSDRKDFNLFLENFFQKNGMEELNYLKHYFFCRNNVKV